MSALDEYIERLGALPPGQRAQVEEIALASTKKKVWVPNPGPQTDAYLSEADELLFGGEAGGGKSDLLIGLSLTAHRRSLVLRRTNKEAEKLFDRYEEIIRNDIGKNAQKGWRFQGRIIDIGGCQLESDKQKRKGIPHDLKAFDELVDFTESQYLFITTWTRSADPNQRCRIVATTNPPTDPRGLWVVKRWAAWLDPTHPRPAKSGELRWYTTIGGKDTEVDGPGPHIVDGREVMAKSRTFIRSRLSDNPDLTRTDDYRRTLDALPEELRSAYAEGKFDASLKDQPFQAIPTDWVRAAQARWTPKPAPGIPMCAIGVDCSGGGNDPMVIAARHDGWYAPMVVTPGAAVPKDRPGKFAAGMVVSYRTDNCPVVVDMGGGYGGPLFETLRDNSVEVHGHKGAEAATGRTRDGQLAFFNMRSQVIWRFREALDPSQPGGSPISLPPDPEIIADLCSPTWRLTPRGIQIEPKEDVVERIGRSTNKGDAIVLAWARGPTHVTDGEAWRAAAAERSQWYGRRPQVVMARTPRTRRNMGA